ncbi:TonB-dependent siderophore receptor [Paracidovorax anthurii]|uniref:Iron complex outermembrane receptor protein n=1 Tax=Paracidovorax anthurii TaxID=78229 RepID=A0A328ZN49_9BURK|nr:TonB-dependent receptor [Paracidovorax anthurii]RAR86162.1 iron complex outermembrane receptor protein [Paracidovorax anthurii]
MHVPLRLSLSSPRPGRLGGLACAALLACALPSPPLRAAEPPAAAVALDIPAGPLAATLTRIGQGSGRTIAADPALLAGRAAPPVRGTLTPLQAVRAALAGSGLAVDEVPGGALRVRPLADAAVPPAQPVPAPALAPGAAAAVPAEAALPTVVVQTPRVGGTLMQPTRQVTVIEEQELDDLRATSPSLGALLTKAVPGLSDSSRNLTDFGQTLRGRNVLVLVDGIPLNINRDSSRNLVNIEPARIERVEVLRGSNAIYGSGASGGIISVTTRPVGGEPVAQTTVGMDASLSRPGREGLGGQVQHYFSGRGESIDYEVDVSGRRTGGAYDGHGDRIAPDASQGDLFDSDTYSLGGKLGVRIDARQRLQFAASHLRARQDTDYASDPAVNRAPLGSADARAIRGLVLAEQNQVENTLLSVSYDHQDLAGGTLSATVYARDNFTRFAPSDSRSNTNRGNNVDQVMQNNRVFGGRLTIDTPLGAGRDTRVVWGADFIHERSNMPIDVFDPAAYDASNGLVFRRTGQLTYLPWTTTRSLGAFGQLQHRFSEQWSAEGGLRYERAQASFDDFQPLSQSRLANPATVRGGAVRYDALLYNAGVSWRPVRGHEVYASAGQGFDLPDVGLQLRNAGAGFDIGASDLKPVKTDNYELGWRGRWGDAMGTLAVFHSRSDLGAIQSFNNGLRLLRTRERIRGVEATLDVYGDAWSTGGTLTWMQGRETPQGALQDQIMTGYRIPPLKLTGYVQYQAGERWSVRAQLTWFGSRDYRLADGRTQFARADVRGYHTVDVVGRYRIDPRNSVTVGVQNLFNRQYLPLYSQLMRSGSNNSRLPAAVLTASYTHRW